MIRWGNGTVEVGAKRIEDDKTLSRGAALY